MASFGSFETEREVYSDPIYAVYSARKRGDPGGPYAVKVFHLPHDGLEAELAGEAAGGREEVERARLSSVSVQEQAAAGSRFIAPVFERGNDDRCVWYATPFYPRSVNKMMSGKVALPRASLEHIIRSIAQGALDLKRACGRSHGDIRPTNVQVSKSEKLSEAEVVLCDPLPGGKDEAFGYELSDLQAIGLILVQLVRQRAISKDDLALLLPIAPSADWTRVFGGNAGEWLAVCNRLLDPNLSPDQFTLEDLVKRLEDLKPKRGGSPKLVIAGAAALVVIAAAGLWALRPRLETVEVTSDPPGATILVDESKNGATPVRLRLRKGSHVIEARQDQLGLSPTATNCVVEAGTLPRIHFQFAYGSVAIKSDPPGAEILRGGVVIDRTTMDGQPFVITPVAPGVVRYQLRLERYEPAEIAGVVSNHQRLELAATLRRSEVVKPPPVEPAPVAAVETNTAAPATPPSPGEVELRAEPVPAAIFDSDGKNLGSVTGDAPLKLPFAAGKYSFVARTEGLDDVSAIVTVEAGKSTPYTFTFDYGTVNWATEPATATVSVNGQSRPGPASFIQKPGIARSYVIAAPGYQTTTNEVTVKSSERKSIIAKLLPQLVAVELRSDPPGAEFSIENGAALARSEPNKSVYYLPPGTASLVARHAKLGALTNRVELLADRTGASVRFKFDYGTLILTNLPPDLTVYEGETKVGSAADKWVYQKPGAHAYALRGRTSSLIVQTNINAGLNFIGLVVAAEKAWKNDFGMWFAWVPNLPGGGVWAGQTEPGAWVGIAEVTQGQYKKMDGTNPSVYRDGGDNYPVENVTWEQAMNFCRWLSSKDTAERAGWRYTLPTDEQFSFFSADADRFARVVSEGRMTGIQDSRFDARQRGLAIPAVANLNTGRTHPEPDASTKQPNQHGLYDVLGNVSEWLAASNGREGVYAGGSYLSPKTVGTKVRERGFEKGPNIGFRVVLVPLQ